MNFDDFLSRNEFSRWQTHFRQAIFQRTDPKRHGDLASWLNIVSNMPEAKPSVIELNKDTITIGTENDIPFEERPKLKEHLLALAPWRKGPYNLFGNFIDTEWRSDWKWQRLAPFIKSLSNRKVLDVGCGTGYHCWRMLGAGADYVMGIDPSMRFAIQHRAINQYVKENRFDFLPIGIEDMPQGMAFFDSVFSMGVLYHRRNPINHLIELHDLLTVNGELILETLIVNDSDELVNGTLQPIERYAQMRNVWSVMTIKKILTLLTDAGFKNPRCVDENTTSIEEQRRTDWMQYHSLREFLDPNDLNKTIEGYPAPRRGIFIAEK